MTTTAICVNARTHTRAHTDTHTHTHFDVQRYLLVICLSQVNHEHFRPTENDDYQRYYFTRSAHIRVQPKICPIETEEN
jgi:hypothetical protein